MGKRARKKFKDTPLATVCHVMEATQALFSSVRPVPVYLEPERLLLAMKVNRSHPIPFERLAGL